MVVVWDARTGPIPTAIGELVQLRLLSLRYSKRTGPSCAAVANLPARQKTHDVGVLFQTCVSAGRIPTEIGRLSELRALDLEGNQLTGSF